jgi:hypothetical protein
VPFTAGEWHQLKLVFDARHGWYEAWVDGEKVKERIEHHQGRDARANGLPHRLLAR